MLKIDVWSDVVCPWCYIGKRRLEAAIARHDEAVAVTWRSFELAPRAPAAVDMPLDELLSRKYGMPMAQVRAMHDRVTRLGEEVGIEFRFDLARTGNTFDAHRLLQSAPTHDLRGALKERLLRAYFTEGAPISDRATLAALAAEVGLDGDRAAADLASDAYTAEVRADEAEARAIGATGVPFFRLDDRFGISGAQDVETMLMVFDQVRAARPATMLAGDACGPDSCDA